MPAGVLLERKVYLCARWCDEYFENFRQAQKALPEAPAPFWYIEYSSPVTVTPPSKFVKKGDRDYLGHPKWWPRLSRSPKMPKSSKFKIPKDSDPKPKLSQRSAVETPTAFPMVSYAFYECDVKISNART